MPKPQSEQKYVALKLVEDGRLVVMPVEEYKAKAQSDELNWGTHWEWASVVEDEPFLNAETAAYNAQMGWFDQELGYVRTMLIDRLEDLGWTVSASEADVMESLDQQLLTPFTALKKSIFDDLVRTEHDGKVSWICKEDSCEQQ